ncbi:alkaline phosphatase D family protein [Naumannella sp. ID2617S]|nr:alkaline phosphatase D family protein [Naumannella sp. ID2617S]
MTRRLLLGGSAAAAALAALPLTDGIDWVAVARAAEAGGFGYGVASGDPLADRVIIWTRVTPLVGGRPALPGSGLGDPLPVRWEVFADAALTCLVASGNVTATAASDHTVKVDVPGLQPYTAYYYRFTARGETSPVGRMRTAPDEAGKMHALRFGQVSCSSYTSGYFQAYRAMADRDDLDFVLHLGDYIYEYANDSGPFGSGERAAEPAHETISLADYRLRYATHRADADCRRCHQRHPFIAIFDDHETANNAWSDGAENHNPGEGSYADRKRAGYQAYAEWLPVRITNADPHRGTQFFRRFTFGSLADLSVIETRQNRSEQVGGKYAFVLVGDPATDATINHPGRQIMEPEQMRWLKGGLTTARTWHLIGNQVMVSPLAWPGQYLGAPQGTILSNTDAWDGYRAQQQELLSHMAAQPKSNGDTVVLTGDIHSSWVENLVGDPAAQVRVARAAAAQVQAAPGTTPTGPAAGRRSGEITGAGDQGTAIPRGVHQRLVVQPGTPASARALTPAGVEFVCPSITSDGLYEFARQAVQSPTLSLAAVTAAEPVLRVLNPSLQYFNGVGHGYILIDVTPQRVQADYYYTPTPSETDPDPRRRRDAAVTYASSWQTLAGSRVATEARGPVGARRDQPYAAPCQPQSTPTAPGTQSPPSPGAPSTHGTPPKESVGGLASTGSHH